MLLFIQLENYFVPLEPTSFTFLGASSIFDCNKDVCFFFFLLRLSGGFGSGLLLSMIMAFSPTPQSCFPSRKTTGGIGHGLLLLNLSDSNACWAHAQWVPTHSPRNPPLPFALACACPLSFFRDFVFICPTAPPAPSHYTGLPPCPPPGLAWLPHGPGVLDL